MQLLSQQSDRRWALAGSVLRVLAETGFFSVVYAAGAVVLGHHPPFLGPIEFTLLVGAGAVIGGFARESPEVGALVLIAAVLGGGALGWLASPDTRSLLPEGVLTALGSHLIGWIGAFAVLRGSLITESAASAEGLEQLLRWLLPLVAWLWGLATVLTLPVLWPSFAVYALWGSLTMIVAGLAAIGLVRLRHVHADVAETSVRRVWRWLVIAAAIGVVPLSLPFMVLAGVPLGMLFRPIAEPVLFVLGLLILPFALIVGALLNLFRPLFGPPGSLPPDAPAEVIHQGEQALREVGPSLAGTVIGLFLAVIVIAVFAVAVYALARWMLRRDPYADAARRRLDDTIEHAIVVPSPAPARPRAAARHRRGAAHDAVGAYVSAVEVLSSHTGWARDPAETPAEHSLRVRAADMPGSPEFSRLAADYQLARYAERSITPRENRRALSRLDRFRRLLRSR